MVKAGAARAKVAAAKPKPPRAADDAQEIKVQEDLATPATPKARTLSAPEADA